jgi:hypothetical protein
VSWKSAVQHAVDCAEIAGLYDCAERLRAAVDPMSAERAAHLLEYAARSIVSTTSHIVLTKGCRAEEILALWDAGAVVARAAALARCECRHAAGETPDVREVTS